MPAKLYWSMEARGAKPTIYAKQLNELLRVDLQYYITELGEWAANRMKELIDQNRKRVKYPKGNLAKYINTKVKTSPGRVEVGVGNIRVLNRYAKYWQVLNSGYTRYGKRFLPGNGKWVPLGYFPDGAPKAGGKGYSWNLDGFSYRFKAKKYVDGIHYIDITRDEAYYKFQTAVARLLSGRIV